VGAQTYGGLTKIAKIGGKLFFWDIWWSLYTGLYGSRKWAVNILGNRVFVDDDDDEANNRVRRQPVPGVSDVLWYTRREIHYYEIETQDVDKLF
jgi:hypothetical protein